MWPSWTNVSVVRRLDLLVSIALRDHRNREEVTFVKEEAEIVKINAEAAVLDKAEEDVVVAHLAIIMVKIQKCSIINLIIIKNLGSGPAGPSNRRPTNKQGGVGEFTLENDQFPALGAK